MKQKTKIYFSNRLNFIKQHYEKSSIYFDKITRLSGALDYALYMEDVTVEEYDELSTELEKEITKFVLGGLQ